MNAHEFKITITLTDEDLRNVLICAVEGGCSEWAAFRQYDPDCGTVMVAENNDYADPARWGAWQEVTLETLRLGVERCANAPRGWALDQFALFMQDHIGDAETADAFLQLGMLGQLKYG